MKQTRKPLLLLAFLLLAFLFSGCGHSEEEHAEGDTTYTCPMHPQVVADEPGDCPICGMDLVPVSSEGEAIVITDDLEFLLQPTNATVVSRIASINPVMKAKEAEVKMEGIITYDPRQINSVAARVGGRIEQLYVKYNYQPISKGQKLLEIYSPELVTAQKELLFLIQSAPEDTQLIEGAKQRLLLLGATREQINRLIRTGEASYTFAIYSPYNGYALGLNTLPPTYTVGSMPARSTPSSGGGMTGMGSAGSSSAPAGTGMAAQVGEEIQLREGMYVSGGQSLLRVVNPNNLWAEFIIPPGYISAVAKGAPVQINFPQLPGESLEAKVDFFQPFYDAGQNFAKVRVYLPGEQKVAMVGQLVSGQVQFTTPTSLWVPNEAVLDLGTQSVVFVKAGGAYKPVSVTTGLSEKGETQILDGLQQSDVLAGNAQFMVDSESFIKLSNK